MNNCLLYKNEVSFLVMKLSVAINLPNILYLFITLGCSSQPEHVVMNNKYQQ
jgi:hypothetical protein